MLKSHILFDHTKTSKKIKNFLDNKIKNMSLHKCNLIIVIGGDGFMLSALKKYNKYKKPFYGINGGSYGFLMNKFSTKNTIKNLSKAKLVTISPLEMIVKNKFNKNKKSIAIAGSHGKTTTTSLVGNIFNEAGLDPTIINLSLIHI